jgi:Ras GTPase-activating-like protein IQGAP2/3
MIRDEEVETGQKSTLPWDAPLTTVLEHEHVVKALTDRLLRVRTITDRFLQAIIQSLPKMPYPMRFIAQQTMAAVKERFPNADESALLKVVGNLIYYRYMNPAVVAPEAFDVIDSTVSPDQRKTLAEISKMLQQIATGKQFDADAVHMTALNDYMATAQEQFSAFFRAATEVPSAEDHYQIDPLDDVAQMQKPVVYISANELFTTHALLLEGLDDVARGPEDKDLRELLGTLGVPPETGADQPTHGNEFSLTLTNKFVNVDQTDVENRTLFVQTKRFCLNVMRVQRGKTLLDILESPVTNEHLKIYELQQAREATIQQERAAKDSAAASSSGRGLAGKRSVTEVALAETSLVDLKKLALENLDRLERVGMVTKDNAYQDMLTAIGRDIRNKNRRRILRRSELTKLKGTLFHLQRKAEYLESQKQSYMDYVQSCMSAMQEKNKKATKKTVLPFTRQYAHMQQLKRQGKTPKFGSYEYDAQRLHEKGVLVELKEVPAANWKRVAITIASDEVGVFEVQGKFMGVNLYTTELRLEDLLQRQFDHVQTMTLFGTAVVNVNLLLFLINKKFYV